MILKRIVFLNIETDPKSLFESGDKAEIKKELFLLQNLIQDE